MRLIMESQKHNHRDEMFDALSEAIEKAGKTDKDYSNYDKALDILDVLENLLAYTIFSTCLTTEQIRDSCEESYFAIKKRALQIYHNENEKKEN